MPGPDTEALRRIAKDEIGACRANSDVRNQGIREEIRGLREDIHLALNQMRGNDGLVARQAKAEERLRSLERNNGKAWDRAWTLLALVVGGVVTWMFKRDG